MGAAEGYTPAASFVGPWEVGSVTFEIELPDEWPPGLGFAVAKMIRQSLKAGFPHRCPSPERCHSGRARGGVQHDRNGHPEGGASRLTPASVECAPEMCLDRWLELKRPTARYTADRVGRAHV